MTRETFERLVREAIDSIPSRFRKRMTNVAVVVEDEPSPAMLREMEIEPPDTLFGLYQGTPLTQRSWDFGNALPDRITIYQRPIEEECRTDDEIVATIGETLIHELGHYFGMSEEHIQEIEDRYWARFWQDRPDDEEPIQGDEDGPGERNTT
ncbi:MAG: metallopeptidase family protein [Acidobacteria bacterium]|nr:metallopeptidase family protein [Acidobacteriota bacterium]